MDTEEILLHIALLGAPGVDGNTYHQIIRRWGSLSAAVGSGTEALSQELGLLPPMVEPIVRLRDAVPEARELLGELAEHEVTVLIPSNPAYPQRLARFPDYPFLLLCRGDVGLFERRAVSIVGSRQASEMGQGLAFEIAVEAGRRDIVVVSGFASGIDQAAHRGALEGGGSTIAVLPHGILRLSERRSYRVFASAAAEAPETFVALSHFHPTAAISAETALERNWTIAALGEATLVVEARRSGGSHRTARDARALGLPLFVVDWKESIEQNEGNPILIQRGGIPIDPDLPPEEILSRLLPRA